MKKNGKFIFSKTVDLQMDKLAKALQVFSNPATNTLQVQTLMQGTLQVSVFDRNGKAVKNTNSSNYCTATTIPFNIINLNNRMYLLTAKGANAAEKVIFIKE